MRNLLTLLLLTACIFSTSLSAQKCSILVSVNKGCIPQPVSFACTITGTPTGKTLSYSWDFKDGTYSTQKDSITHIYNKRGTYHPAVTINWSGGSCTAIATSKLQIFDNPKADFKLAANGQVFLCNPSSDYCFTDASKKGTDSALIKSWYTNFGDGEFSKSKSPCHHYFTSGTYTISMEVKDSNGCKNFMQRKVDIKYLKNHGLPPLKFEVKEINYCDKSYKDVIFTNLTDTSTDSIKIDKFIWKFGDGTRDSCYLSNPSCAVKWTGFTHRYSKPGNYTPYLIAENKYGCKDSVKLDTLITVYELPKKGVSAFPREICMGKMGENTINFSAVPDTRPGTQYFWYFGDPRDSGVGRTKDANHNYKRNGIYTIIFKRVNDVCVWDTVLCLYVKINGPVAKIMYYDDVDTVPQLPIIRKVKNTELKNYFDSCQTDTTYWVKKTFTIPNGDTTYGDPCKGNKVTLKTGYANNCSKQKLPAYETYYVPKPLSTNDLIVDSFYRRKWNYSKPFPYSDTPFYVYKNYKPRKYAWKDTTLFPLSCTTPYLVQFTNYSIKGRNYPASDDIPIGSPDRCQPNYNPYFPYASDSLTYYWDFKEGKKCVSTRKSPDSLCRYSSEKLPKHLFTKEGCYMVVLRTSDTATKCTTEDSIPIIVQKPDAGWDRKVFDTIKNMTMKLQKKIAGKGRRGMIVNGQECLEAIQPFSIDELLPGCFKPKVLICFDSAKVNFGTCRGATDSSKINYKWYDASKLDQGIGVPYNDSGWKTLGVVVSTNSKCVDTVWYHNYKYIHYVNAELNNQPDMVCLRDTLRVKLKVPTQKGIKLGYLRVQYEHPEKGVIKRLTDTFKYIIRKNKITGNIDTITSSIKDKTLGVFDDTVVNFLDSVFKIPADLEGRIFITCVLFDRFGCSSTSSALVYVGHYRKFKVVNEIVCANEPVDFIPDVSYFHTVFNKPPLYTTYYWEDPVKARNGFKTKFPEKVKWDLDGDGTIDDTSAYPSFIYKKPGLYDVTLYTRDSNNCWLSYTQKKYIRVIQVKADFTIDSPGFERFCAPQFFKVTDLSTVLDTPWAGSSKVSIRTWTWSPGDGSIYTKDANNKNISFVHLHNGEYQVRLIARTGFNSGSFFKGCADTTYKYVKITGPIPRFKPLDSVGCVPFTYKALDYSRRSRFKDWKLGDGTVVSKTAKDTSQVADTVFLLYTKPGTYCPQLTGADSIRDFLGNINFCYDTFPFKKCRFKVVVKPRKFAGLFGDTIVCVNKVATFSDASDTIFHKWEINFGDGTPSKFYNKAQTNITHTYTKVGNYTLIYKASGYECPDSIVRHIKVVDLKADFYIDPLYSDTPYFRLINQSRDAVRFKWIFDDGEELNVSNMDPVIHYFNRAGSLNVCLVAYNKQSCFDKVCHPLKIDTGVVIYNVFTPEQKDQHNDRFVIDIWGHTSYKINIYNRWGEKVFTSNNRSDTWDGTYLNKGTLCPAGVYYFTFDYQLLSAPVRRKQGSVTLIR